MHHPYLKGLRHEAKEQCVFFFIKTLVVSFANIADVRSWCEGALHIKEEAVKNICIFSEISEMVFNSICI